MTILKLRKNKIKSLECINSKTLISCDHLWIGSMFGMKFVPYYCDVKCQEILKPNGKRKCKFFRATDTSNWITKEIKNEN